MSARFEIIDSSDIIVAEADTREDAIYALAALREKNLFAYASAYIYDTKTKRVVK